jgi:hypothetical protein
MDVKRRVNLCNSHEVYMLVLAKKLREPGELPAPQQSDYAQDEWLKAPSTGSAKASGGSRKAVVQQLVKLGLIDTVRSMRERVRVVRQSGLSLPAPDYQRVDVHQLIGAKG